MLLRLAAPQGDLQQNAVLLSKASAPLITKTLAGVRGVRLDSGNPAEEQFQLHKLHDELASEVRKLLKDRMVCVDAVAKELLARWTLSGLEIHHVARLH